MIERRIPLSFVQARVPLTWSDLSLGVREDWLGAEDAVLFARSQLEEGKEDSDILELAGLTRHELDQVGDVLPRLVNKGPERSERESRLTWMRILLAWLYVNRAEVADPLAVVEEIYSDFGYPEEIRELVRYNTPMDSSSSEPSGDSVLLQRWKDYLDATSRPDQPSRPDPG